MKKVILMILIGFLSCDKYTTYSMYIDNQTEDTIEIVFSEGSPYSSIAPSYLTFPPGTKKLFYAAEGTQTKYACDYTGIMENEIEVFTSSGQKLQKKIWVVKNWRCSGNNNQGWEQTFIITEDDLE